MNTTLNAALKAYQLDRLHRFIAEIETEKAIAKAKIKHTETSANGDQKTSGR